MCVHSRNCSICVQYDMDLYCWWPLVSLCFCYNSMKDTVPFRKVHAWSVSPSLAANKFAVGLLGNLFTEELAGRVLTAESPGRAKLACSIASLLFGFIGLSPAILGVWAKSQGILQMEGHNLCDESQDQVIGLAVSRLLPEGELFGKEQSILVAILILESLNTVDTSILMCGKVMANQARRLQMFDRSWADHAAIVLALSVSVLETILFRWKVLVTGQVFCVLLCIQLIPTHPSLYQSLLWGLCHFQFSVLPAEVWSSGYRSLATTFGNSQNGPQQQLVLHLRCFAFWSHCEGLMVQQRGLAQCLHNWHSFWSIRMECHFYLQSRLGEYLILPCYIWACEKAANSGNPD